MAEAVETLQMKSGWVGVIETLQVKITFTYSTISFSP